MGTNTLGNDMVYEIGALDRMKRELEEYRDKYGNWIILEDDNIQVAVMASIRSVLNGCSKSSAMNTIIEEVDKFLDAKKDEGLIDG